MGTLIAPQILYRVCYGNSNPEPWQSLLLTIRPAILHDFCRRKVRYRDYPAIIPQANSAVRGTLVTGLTEGDIYRLDIFEGSDYARKKVKVKVLAMVEDDPDEGNAEGGEIDTETYVWISGEEALEHGGWDFREFVKKKLARWAAADEEYKEVDEAMQSRPVDPSGGRGGQIASG
ncbi:MAG: hypothetical protein M1840_004322 [Geoglossum simile]|nr:MAG: hypothetical protein M1840_004322 [Geoglossum simile]